MSPSLSTSVINIIFFLDLILETSPFTFHSCCPFGLSREREVKKETDKERKLWRHMFVFISVLLLEHVDVVSM